MPISLLTRVPRAFAGKGVVLSNGAGTSGSPVHRDEVSYPPHRIQKLAGARLGVRPVSPALGKLGWKIVILSPAWATRTYLQKPKQKQPNNETIITPLPNKQPRSSFSLHNGFLGYILPKHEEQKKKNR